MSLIVNSYLKMTNDPQAPYLMVFSTYNTTAFKSNLGDLSWLKFYHRVKILVDLKHTVHLADREIKVGAKAGMMHFSWREDRPLC